MKGNLLVVHDLNLQTLRQDLEGNNLHEGISPDNSIFMISISKLSIYRSKPDLQ